jgi:hypothetical protein
MKNSLQAIGFVAMFLFVSITLSYDAFARGGGGGSGGGGGGGGGSSASGGSGGGTSGPATLFEYVLLFIIIAVLAIVVWYVYYLRKKRIAATKLVIAQAALQDTAWDQNNLTDRVKDVFLRFQKDWSNLDPEPMREYLSESYYKRMVLEMNVLRNEGRRNDVNDPQIRSIVILDATDNMDNTKDFFTAEITASALDILTDTKSEDILSLDDTPFIEYWTFVRDGDIWRLDIIKQKTEDASMKNSAIEEFSARNNFYYDPDFGWLMMPNKGAIFRKTNFKNSDINNHAIGYFREKIVEFYSYIPSEKGSEFIIAQAIIPKAYHDILVHRKHSWFNIAPRGLKQVTTESIAFDKRFVIFADPTDQVSSLELLTPNFMEKIYALPFELNIEVVGNFLYLYAKKQGDIDYDQMLEILSWAFDEMER